VAEVVNLQPPDSNKNLLATDLFYPKGLMYITHQIELWK
jgi:hypothetical protein